MRSEFHRHPSPMAESRRARDHDEECYTAEEDHSHPSTFTPSPSFSSSSSSCPETELAATVLSKKAGQGDGDDGADDEEGYHTPTSPRHRIPEAVDCPPAPKKSGGGCRKKKRSGRPVCWIHNFDLELMCFFMEAEDLRPMRKKVRSFLYSSPVVRTIRLG